MRLQRSTPYYFYKNITQALICNFNEIPGSNAIFWMKEVIIDGIHGDSAMKNVQFNTNNQLITSFPH